MSASRLVSRWKRKVGVSMVILGACLAIIVTRAVWDGRDALRRGDEAAALKNSAEAITWWRRAARWYVPGAPHVAGAYERLEGAARAAERAGDTAVALAAWRGIRGSILATRSVYTPFFERLEPANRRIAELMASIDERSGSPEEKRQWHYDLLSRDESPAAGWSILAILGLLLWVGGGFYFAARGMSAEGRLIRRGAMVSAAMIIVGLVVWLWALYLA